MGCNQCVPLMTADDSLDCLPPQVHCLIELARVNYQREVRCEPLHMLPLNRLFLGNPGTGKTSIAKVYGRILKGLGYLSDGSVEVRTPSDLIASAVGGTEEKTAALLEICKGKVLVIDEAYALHEGMYGAPAPSTRSLSACKCSPRPAPPSPQVRRARHRHDRLQGA